MTTAKQGTTVRVHYTGRLPDGTEFDSSRGRDPIEFELGAGQIIPGFEKEVEGMTEGETSSVTIKAEDAYGPHQPDRVQKVDRSQLPAEVPVEVGTQLQATTQNGQQIPLTVVEVGEKEVTLDANHPLAGKDLVFDLELVEVK